MSMEEYNHVIHTMVNNVNASADEFGKYFDSGMVLLYEGTIDPGRDQAEK